MPDSEQRNPSASPDASDTRIIHSDAGDYFRCFSCGRRFAWKPQIAGKTFRCPCEAKVRVPEPGQDTLTAEESLDDTVADVEVDQHFDEIDSEKSVDSDDSEATEFRRIPQRGVFGWPMGLDVLFWSILSLVGVSCGIMALLLWKYWWEWTVAFIVIGPYSFLRLYRSWPRWTQGRPWIDCLLETLGADEDEEDSAARTAR